MGRKYIIEIIGGEEGDMDFSTIEPYTEPDMEQVRKEAYEDGYKTAKVQCNIQAEKDLREVGERHYQKGLSDAWEAARKVVALSTVDRRKVFGSEYMYSILEKHTASEAIEKMKEQEEIKVGDEVSAEFGNAIVVGITESCARCVYSNGKHATLRIVDATRTGRHFPEIATVLQKMRETE